MKNTRNTLLAQKYLAWKINLKAFTPGNNITSLPYAAKEISTFLVEANLAKQTPELSQLFDDRFIKAYAAKQKLSS